MQALIRMSKLRLFCGLLAVVHLASTAGCSVKIVEVNKPTEYIKLGQTPVLSFEPEKGSEQLHQLCRVRQSKLADYIDIPYRTKMNLPIKGKPFSQIINMHDLSFLIYRRDQNSHPNALILSKLPTRKSVTWPISNLMSLIDNEELKFMPDLASMHSSNNTNLYFMSDERTLVQLKLGKHLELQGAHKLNLPRVEELRRLLVFNSTVYILDFNKVIKITLDPHDFATPKKVKTISLKREYTDMAILNGTFAFLRGYSTLVFSDKWNPESQKATISPLKFRHGKFTSAGFDHFVLIASETETGDMKYFGFQRDEHNRSISAVMLKGSPSSKSSLLQFKHAIYHILPKSMSVEYLGSQAELVTLDKPIRGQLHGIVGHYDRTEESLHPVASIRLRLKKKLRFRKHFLNCLHSELVCTNLNGTYAGKSFKARILTRKTKLEMDLQFQISKPSSAFAIPDLRASGQLTSMPNQTKPVVNVDPIHLHPIPNSNTTKDDKKTEDKKDSQKEQEKQAIRNWIHYAVLICLILVLGVLCLMRLTIKREIRGMEATDQIIGATPTPDPALFVELNEVSTDPGFVKSREKAKQHEAEVSLNQTDADITYRIEKPIDESVAEIEDPPMPDMTL